MIQPYAYDVPVSVQGVTVVPDDYIFADSTGAAVIPPGAARDILTLASSIKNMAAAVAESIKDEDPDEVLRLGSKEI